MNIATAKLNSYITKSFFLHLLFVGVMAIVSYRGFIFIKEKRSANLKLIEASVRVDIVSMPKLTVKQLQAMSLSKAKGVEKPLPAKKKQVKSNETSKVEFKKKVKKKSFADMLKNISKTKLKKEKLKKVKPKKRGQEDGDDWGELEKLVVEGNKVNTGSAIVGTGKGGDNSAYELYVLSLPNHIKPYWTLPSYLMNKDLSCRIRIFLSKTGQLLKATIYTSSGNEEYDNKAMDAVKVAVPFPSLDKEFMQKGLNGDILLAFPL